MAVDSAVMPHGGLLVDLRVGIDRATELRGRSGTWPSWRLTHRQLCDLELLACGAFSPLASFSGEDDYKSVCELTRLADGTLWPIPVTLDVPEDVVAAAESAGTLALRDADGTMLAALHLTEAWRPDRRADDRPDAVVDVVSAGRKPVGPGKAGGRSGRGAGRSAAHGRRSAAAALCRAGNPGVDARAAGHLHRRPRGPARLRDRRLPRAARHDAADEPVDCPPRRASFCPAAGVSPGRWGEDTIKELPRFAYFPFGGGPRQCIGNTFALMETVLVLTMMAQRYRFTLLPGHPVEPWPTFTLRPRFGIKAVITPRQGTRRRRPVHPWRAFPLRVPPDNTGRAGRATRVRCRASTGRSRTGSNLSGTARILEEARMHLFDLQRLGLPAQAPQFQSLEARRVGRRRVAQGAGLEERGSLRQRAEHRRGRQLVGTVAEHCHAGDAIVAAEGHGIAIRGLCHREAGAVVNAGEQPAARPGVEPGTGVAPPDVDAFARVPLSSHSTAARCAAFSEERPSQEGQNRGRTFFKRIRQMPTMPTPCTTLGRKGAGRSGARTSGSTR